MRGSSSEARMKYLSLALFAQRMVDALIDFVSEDKRDLMTKYSKEAVDSLRTMLGSGDHSPRTRALRHYEQVRTITETAPDPATLQKVIATLERLNDPTVAKAQKVRDARKLIDFFHKVEKQALLNCNRPDKPLPRGLHELLRAR